MTLSRLATCLLIVAAAVAGCSDESGRAGGGGATSTAPSERASSWSEDTSEGELTPAEVCTEIANLPPYDYYEPDAYNGFIEAMEDLSMRSNPGSQQMLIMFADAGETTREWMEGTGRAPFKKMQRVWAEGATYCAEYDVALPPAPTDALDD